MPKCEAHDIMYQELQRVKDNQSELYSLERKKSDEMSEIKEDIATLKQSGKTMQQDIEELKNGMEEVKATTSALKTDVKGLKQDMTDIKESIQNKKWKPADYVAIIVAFISMVGTVAVAIISM